MGVTSVYGRTRSAVAWRSECRNRAISLKGRKRSLGRKQLGVTSAYGGACSCLVLRIAPCCNRAIGLQGRKRHGVGKELGKPGRGGFACATICIAPPGDNRAVGVEGRKGPAIKIHLTVCRFCLAICGALSGLGAGVGAVHGVGARRGTNAVGGRHREGKGTHLCGRSRKNPCCGIQRQPGWQCAGTDVIVHAQTTATNKIRVTGKRHNRWADRF